MVVTEKTTRSGQNPIKNNNTMYRRKRKNFWKRKKERKAFTMIGKSTSCHTKSQVINFHPTSVND